MGVKGQTLMKLNSKALTKINDFYGKYKLFIGLGVVSVLLFACPFNEKMWLAVSVVLGLFMLTFSIGEIFATMLFMTPFSGLDSLYVITIIMALVIVLLKYVIDVVLKRKKVFWFPLGVTLAIIALSTLKSFLIGERNIETGMLLIFVFALCYFAFVYRKEISVSKCFNALLVGLFVSVGITLVLRNFEEFEYYICSYDGIYKRLKMTTFHMNNLALLCIFEFAYSVHSVLNKSRNILIDIVAIVLSTTLGVLTLSKVFLVMLAVFILYFMLALVVKLKKRSIKYLVMFAGLIVVLCVVGKSYIAHIYDRMFLYNNGDNFWNEILNGRVDIWKDYLTDFKSSWHNICFGVGLFRPNFEFDPHNAYLFVLHRFGIVGILAIFVLIFAYIKSSNSKFRFKFLNILLLFTWLIIGLEEVVLSDQFAIYLIFALMLIFKDEKDVIVKINENSADTEAEKTDSKTNETKTQNVQQNKESKTKTENKPKIEVKSKPEHNNQNENKQKIKTDINSNKAPQNTKRKLKIKYNQLSKK